MWPVANRKEVKSFTCCYSFSQDCEWNRMTHPGIDTWVLRGRWIVFFPKWNEATFFR